MTDRYGSKTPGLVGMIIMADPEMDVLLTFVR